VFVRHTLNEGVLGYPHFAVAEVQVPEKFTPLSGAAYLLFRESCLARSMCNLSPRSRYRDMAVRKDVAESDTNLMGDLAPPQTYLYLRSPSFLLAKKTARILGY